MKTKVIYFTASWCGACKVMEPALDDLMNNTSPNLVDYFKYDVDLFPDKMTSYDVNTLPTIVIERGFANQKLIGGQSTQKISDTMDAVWHEYEDQNTNTNNDSLNTIKDWLYEDVPTSEGKPTTKRLKTSIVIILIVGAAGLISSGVLLFQKIRK